MGAIGGNEEIRSDLQTHQHEQQETLEVNLEGTRSRVLRW
jgi:hypothetical protein